MEEIKPIYDEKCLEMLLEINKMPWSMARERKYIEFLDYEESINPKKGTITNITLKTEFVVVDKVKIFFVIRPIYKSPDSLEILGFRLRGQYTEFYVPNDRCSELDSEYAIILNLYGATQAEEYARKQGFIE